MTSAPPNQSGNFWGGLRVASSGAHLLLLLRGQRVMFIKPLLGVVAAVAAAPWAFGAISASTMITTTSTNAPFNYTMSVTNTGTVPIGTLWFAWTNVPIT